MPGGLIDILMIGIIKIKQWRRLGQFEVVLKKFDGIVDITINEDFLNEMTIYLRTSGNKITSTTLYGITKDPETHEYMMVLEYFKGGSLRNYLNNTFNNINWYNKLDYLKDLAEGFLEIHKLDIVHRDFHIYQVAILVYISDFGLNIPKPKNDENFVKKLEELTKSFYQINSSKYDDVKHEIIPNTHMYV
ncbi:hypothetical protein Glove_212g249 [Diversispora epigaea]|uniref:Protein kinase domain-containing protein n=1 Tax=Diversispora epigaea TaxID=1348612 RepID=A0A397II81_9GLOM|nr:hypothetical protein Glove_212g249 [Diversispora epigaea]